MDDEETRDTSSNPLDDDHLSVGGEVDSENGERDPDINRDIHGDDDDEDMTDRSAHSTEDIDNIPDPDGPADPDATET